MKRVIKHAYEGKSWKNVVSIGDGEAEFNAMRAPRLPRYRTSQNGMVRFQNGMVIFVGKHKILVEHLKFPGSLMVFLRASST